MAVSPCVEVIPGRVSSDDQVEVDFGWSPEHGWSLVRFGCDPVTGVYVRSRVGRPDARMVRQARVLAEREFRHF